MTLHPGTDQVFQEQDGSGVTGGQVETAKYIVFRYVTASFFTGYVSDFHEKHQDSALWVRIVCSYVNSIPLLDIVLLGRFPESDSLGDCYTRNNRGLYST